MVENTNFVCSMTGSQVVTLPAGQFIKINGVPLILRGSVEAESASNHKLLRSHSEPEVLNPAHAAGKEATHTSSSSSESKKGMSASRI